MPLVDFKAIKEKYSVIDVARDMLGLELEDIGGGQWRGVSPSPGEHKTNDALAVTDSVWYDHSAHIGGSVLDLVAFVKFGNVEKESIIEAAKLLAGDDYDSHYWQEYAETRRKFREEVQTAHEALLKDEKTLDYLHKRRINDETIERFSLGLLFDKVLGEWRLSIPYKDKAGNPIYKATRVLDWMHNPDAKYIKYKKADTQHNNFFKNTILGLNTLPAKDSECGTVALGEGVVDFMSCAQEAYPSLFAVGGAYGKENIPTLIKEARRFRERVSCFDIDENNSGQGFTCNIGRLFLKEKMTFSAVESYGEGCKDISDFYTAGGDIHELFSHTVNGYVFMAKRTFWENKPILLADDYSFYRLSPNEQAKRLGQVKQFVYSLKEFLDPLAFAEVIEALAEYYPRDKIDQYTKGPNAQEVLCSMRDSFLDGRKLFFYGSTLHGEYWQYDNERGYYYRMTDADLQSEISAFFRHELNNKTISQLTTMIRLMCTKSIMPTFNKKRVEVFPNGTLELDTGKFREHSSDDYATWSHTFDYDENATCTRYDAFIQEVSMNEQSRIDFLDDMCGYGMYEDCRLEKMFVLIGEGNNGKSIFLRTLEALFESSNQRDNSQSVTHVQPKTLDKPTDRITLESSVLNLAIDIDPNLKGCEDSLKSLISGDTISGNFKFHDTRSFKSRSKLICSSNRMIKVADDSYGMRRKIAFCQFAADFTDNADVHLEGKLKAELPGIFNRVYRAYRALLEREKTLGKKALRESIDQEEYMSEFRNIADPISAFWLECGDDFTEKQEVPKAEVFDAYKTYCERNSLYPDTENMFHGRLKKIFKERGISYKEIRHREKNKQVYYYTFSGTQAKSPLEKMLDDYENGQITLDLQ